MKKCFKCGKKKDISQFYTHKEMGDGHLGKCKTCTKKDVKDRYKDPEARKRIAEYERLRFKNPERKAKIKEYRKNRRNKHKGKHRANNQVTNAIRNGKLVRKPCEVCGSSKSQAHHPDYRKPLYVKWLCFRHHRELHGQKVL
jgi:hypothetical protein